jgi:hypothetical protein
MTLNSILGSEMPKKEEEEEKKTKWLIQYMWKFVYLSRKRNPLPDEVES